MIFTICGGGSLSHVIAGYIAAKKRCEVNILTRNPYDWSSTIIVDDPAGKVFSGDINMITDDASKVIPHSDVVLLCVPGFGIKDILLQIAPYVSSQTFVGSVVSSTGFFRMAFDICTPEQQLFGFQRVPFIARVSQYGHSAHLLGYKQSINMAIVNADEKKSQLLKNQFESLLDLPVNLLNNYYEAALTNSNPLLHPSRIYTMWKDWQPGLTYSSCPLFYADWTDEASELYIKMDNEFQHMLTQLPQEVHITDVLTYYESSDASSLTRKLRSIKAFCTIPSPMKMLNDGRYVPDFQSRYFTEDFPYGMASILSVAEEFSIDIPTIRKIYQWGMNVCSQ